MAQHDACSRLIFPARRLQREPHLVQQCSPGLQGALMRFPKTMLGYIAINIWRCSSVPPAASHCPHSIDNIVGWTLWNMHVPGKTSFEWCAQKMRVVKAATEIYVALQSVRGAPESFLSRQRCSRGETARPPCRRGHQHAIEVARQGAVTAGGIMNSLSMP